MSRQRSDLVTCRYTPTGVVHDPVVASHLVAIETFVSGEAALAQEEKARRAMDAPRIIVVGYQR